LIISNSNSNFQNKSQSFPGRSYSFLLLEFHCQHSLMNIGKKKFHLLKVIFLQNLNFFSELHFSLKSYLKAAKIFIKKVFSRLSLDLANTGKIFGIEN